MSVVFKLICILTILAIAEYESVNSAGAPCGKVSPEKKAFQLAPCAAAAKNARAPVSKSCCAQIMTFGRSPQCLCAVLFSRMAKNAGVKPQIAVTIPKRCKLQHQKGTKCGPYIVP